MNLRGSWLALITAVILVLTGASLATAQHTPFERLIDRFRSGQIFKAEFTHEYADSYTEDTVLTEGTIWVGDDEYKVQNRQQVVVVDGEMSRVYDANRNRVIISKYEPSEDDFAPSRFLNGADSTYVVRKQEKKGGIILIVLDSPDPFSEFKTVEITLDEDLVPLRIFAIDQVDNRITTRFQDGSFMPDREDLFVLTYPEEAEIIDMRN